MHVNARRPRRCGKQEAITHSRHALAEPAVERVRGRHTARRRRERGVAGWTGERPDGEPLSASGSMPLQWSGYAPDLPRADRLGAVDPMVKSHGISLDQWHAMTLPEPVPEGLDRRVRGGIADALTTR